MWLQKSSVTYQTYKQARYEPTHHQGCIKVKNIFSSVQGYRMKVEYLIEHVNEEGMSPRRKNDAQKLSIMFFSVHGYPSKVCFLGVFYFNLIIYIYT